MLPFAGGGFLRLSDTVCLVQLRGELLRLARAGSDLREALGRERSDDLSVVFFCIIPRFWEKCEKRISKY